MRPGNLPIKIKAQAADRMIEVEFDPRVMSKDEAIAAARKIQALVEPKA